MLEASPIMTLFISMAAIQSRVLNTIMTCSGMICIGNDGRHSLKLEIVHHQGQITHWYCTEAVFICSAAMMVLLDMEIFISAQ